MYNIKKKKPNSMGILDLNAMVLLLSFRRNGRLSLVVVDDEGNPTMNGGN
jgi:hypothetical protein